MKPVSQASQAISHDVRRQLGGRVEGFHKIQVSDLGHDHDQVDFARQSCRLLVNASSKDSDVETQVGLVG